LAHSIASSDHVIRMHRYRSTNEGDSEVLRFASQVDALTIEQENDVKKQS